MNLDNIPLELRTLPHWVCHRAKAGNQKSKTPLQPNGRKASSTDPKTWSTFIAVQNALANGRNFSGVGFVFTATDGFVGIDLDHVRDPNTGDVVEWAQTLVNAAMADSAYIEVSPSGTGLHLIAKGVMPEGIGHKLAMATGTLEIYATERYFTVTGESVHGPEIIGDGERVLDIVAQWFSSQGRKKTATSPVPDVPNLNTSDAELLDRARRGRNGRKFTSLYDRGDLSAYDDDESRADLALASLIAFWTGPDPGRIDRLFSASALGQRAKWQRADYRERTINAALDGRTEFWKGPAKNQRAYVGGNTNKTPGEDSDTPVNTIVNTDMVNAQRLVRVHGDNIRCTPERGWLLFDGKRWATDDTGAVMGYAKGAALSIFDEIKDSRLQKELFDWARRSQALDRLRAMVELTKSEPGIAARWTEFDPNPFLLNCLNGTLDLQTGELRPHRREDLLSRICPAAWDPQADMEAWDQFVFEVSGRDEELYDYIKRVVGYSLTGDTREQCLFFCYGTGANGKSTLLETLMALLGDHAIAARTQTIMQTKDSGVGNDVAALAGARLVAINETSDGQRLNEPLIKDLTGGDTINARFLYREFFNFRPAFKLWIRGNHKPVIRGTDSGIWRRIHMLPFAVKFEGQAATKNLGDILRANLSGVLRWAVEGCLQWQQIGLDPPNRVLAAVQEYRGEMDILGAFLADLCEMNRNRQVTAKALYAAYRQWCDQSGEHPINQMRFGLAVQERGIAKERSRSGVIYQGLGLNQADNWQV